MSRRGYVTRAQAEADQARMLATRRALEEAEAEVEVLRRLKGPQAAGKALRESTGQEPLERGVEQLERALKTLQEQLKKQEGPAR